MLHFDCGGSLMSEVPRIMQTYLKKHIFAFILDGDQISLRYSGGCIGEFRISIHRKREIWYEIDIFFAPAAPHALTNPIVLHRMLTPKARRLHLTSTRCLFIPSINFKSIQKANSSGKNLNPANYIDSLEHKRLHYYDIHEIQSINVKFLFIACNYPLSLLRLAPGTG